MQIKLINNLTKNTIDLGEVEDSLVSSIFYSFEITLPDGVKDGEYTYELYENGNMVSTGLLQIGDYKQESGKEYNENKKGYIVYGE
jgi:hypothetical protein